MKMNQLNEERIITYISTLNINLDGNEVINESPSDSSRVNKWESPTHTSTSVSPSEDVTSSYRYACERSQGTYFQLIISSCPELSQEDGSSTFQAGKAYFEAFDSNRGESSSSSNDLETKKNEITQSSDFESSQIASSTKVEFETFTIESESKSSSALDVTKSTTTSLTSQTTTTIHETTTTQYVQEATSETYQSSSDHYGETDWYMDILLRMQALDMKQQSLLVQYDFLGKLANENREDLNQARDWARYESDMSQIEVY